MGLYVNVFSLWERIRWESKFECVLESIKYYLNVRWWFEFLKESLIFGRRFIVINKCV